MTGYIDLSLCSLAITIPRLLQLESGDLKIFEARNSHSHIELLLGNARNLICTCMVEAGA